MRAISLIYLSDNAQNKISIPTDPYSTHYGQAEVTHIDLRLCLYRVSLPAMCCSEKSYKNENDQFLRKKDFNG